MEQYLGVEARISNLSVMGLNSAIRFSHFFQTFSANRKNNNIAKRCRGVLVRSAYNVY